MARKEKHYRVDRENKIVYRYKETEASNQDLEDIKLYLECGYEIKWVKAPLTVAKMRSDLKLYAPELLEQFNEAYAEKSTGGDFSDSGFSKACNIYNQWKKERTARQKKAKNEK